MRFEGRENGAYGVAILGVRGLNHLTNVLGDIGCRYYFMQKEGDFEDYRFKMVHSEDERVLSLRVTDRLIIEEGIHRTALFVSGADAEDVNIVAENVRKSIGLTPSPKQDVPPDMGDFAKADLSDLVANFSE